MIGTPQILNFASLSASILILACITFIGVWAIMKLAAMAMPRT